MRKFETLLNSCVKNGFSDLHLTGGQPVVFRKDGVISLTKESPWSHKEMDDFVSKILSRRQLQILQKRWSVDFAMSISHVRVRMNIFSTAAASALLSVFCPAPSPVLPPLIFIPSLIEICQIRAGLVLICGPTGSGKSTTAAAVICEINRKLARHIVTLEDPIQIQIDFEPILYRAARTRHSYTLLQTGATRCLAGRPGRDSGGRTARSRDNQTRPERR